ncbi:SUKH-3 domain-containing protein [Streptomyces sp. VRA16 Mangrove soil]|uniref:SUKH-3 domain-containing protein n=1 Tax=Streptomyces sp. VRA16 Mangrove soil TaxID=2817434 RepID=UPI001E329EAD
MTSPEAVDAWLSTGGRHPGRRCDEFAAAETARAVAEFRADGGQLEVIEPAVAFLREHIGIVPTLSTGPENLSEFSPALMDERGRFFSLHWSAEYYLGDDKYAALMAYSHGQPREYVDLHHS